MIRTGILKRTLAVAVLAMALYPAPVRACAVCFGKSDSPMAQGMNMGIMALLVVVVFMWVTVGGFFVYLLRRKARLQLAGAEATGVTSNS